MEAGAAGRCHPPGAPRQSASRRGSNSHGSEVLRAARCLLSHRPALLNAMGQQAGGARSYRDLGKLLGSAWATARSDDAKEELESDMESRTSEIYNSLGHGPSCQDLLSGLGASDALKARQLLDFIPRCLEAVETSSMPVTAEQLFSLWDPDADVWEIKAQRSAQLLQELCPEPSLKEVGKRPIFGDVEVLDAARKPELTLTKVSEDMDTQTPKSNAVLAELQQAFCAHGAASFFSSLDEAQRGALDREELALGLKRLNVAARASAIHTFTQLLDTNSSGLVERQVFVSKMNTLIRQSVDTESSNKGRNQKEALDNPHVTDEAPSGEPEPEAVESAGDSGACATESVATVEESPGRRRWSRAHGTSDAFGAGTAVIAQSSPGSTALGATPRSPDKGRDDGMASDAAVASPSASSDSHVAGAVSGIGSAASEVANSPHVSGAVSSDPNAAAFSVSIDTNALDADDVAVSGASNDAHVDAVGSAASGVSDSPQVSGVASSDPNAALVSAFQHGHALAADDTAGFSASNNTHVAGAVSGVDSAASWDPPQVTGTVASDPNATPVGVSKEAHADHAAGSGASNSPHVDGAAAFGGGAATSEVSNPAHISDAVSSDADAAPASTPQHTYGSDDNAAVAVASSVDHVDATAISGVVQGADAALHGPVDSAQDALNSGAAADGNTVSGAVPAPPLDSRQDVPQGLLATDAATEGSAISGVVQDAPLVSKETSPADAPDAAGAANAEGIAVDACEQGAAKATARRTRQALRATRLLGAKANAPHFVSRPRPSLRSEQGVAQAADDIS